ncbi:MAG TPA: phosphatase PAP2 family protein [Gemmatimonadales bacterium]|nr:phosphatase PAP2 family protein [Gemmatimonadales bacterium]
MRWLTHLGGARVTLGTGVALLPFGGATTRLGLTVLLANALSHAAVQILKRTVVRARPCDPLGRSLAIVDLPDPFSFPSGHTAAAVSVAATLTLAQPLLGPVLVPLAGLVGYSRVQLRVHYLTDVLAGAGVGLAGAIAALQFLG